MLLGAHWGFWVALVGVVALGVLGLRRRRRHERAVLGAFLEQARRELEHQVAYRPDQRVHALQQRLSRHIGTRRAFSRKMHARIEEELRRNGLGHH